MTTAHAPEQFFWSNTTVELDSMRWFSHRRSPSPPGGTQWYRLLLHAAYGLATAHALLCIVNGDDSAVFFVFCPWWLWPSNSGEIFCTT